MIAILPHPTNLRRHILQCRSCERCLKMSNFVKIPLLDSISFIWLCLVWAFIFHSNECQIAIKAKTAIVCKCMCVCVEECNQIEPPHHKALKKHNLKNETWAEREWASWKHTHTHNYYILTSLLISWNTSDRDLLICLRWRHRFNHKTIRNFNWVNWDMILQMLHVCVWVFGVFAFVPFRLFLPFAGFKKCSYKYSELIRLFGWRACWKVQLFHLRLQCIEFNYGVFRWRCCYPGHFFPRIFGIKELTGSIVLEID